MASRCLFLPETVCNLLHVPRLVWEQGPSNGETARLVWGRLMGFLWSWGALWTVHRQLGSLTLASLLRQTLWYTSPEVPVEPWTPEEPTHQASGLSPYLLHGRVD